MKMMKTYCFKITLKFTYKKIIAKYVYFVIKLNNGWIVFFEHLLNDETNFDQYKKGLANVSPLDTQTI